jgi:hypothetical protein
MIVEQCMILKLTVLKNTALLNMNKDDIKSLLVAAAIVAFGYVLIFGFYYFADYIGIYESLRY